MYSPFKSLALKVLKAPTEPPDPPAGSHASIEIFRAAPSYLRYRFVGYWVVVALCWLVVWMTVIAALVEEEPGLMVAAVVGAIVVLLGQLLAYFLVRIDYDMRYYIVTDRSLRVRQGAWTVKEMTISHANVQNLRVVQGPLLRFFGLWNLEVDTAGGGGVSAKGQKQDSGHTVHMAGIENAHEVRDRILSHLRVRGGGAGLGDLDDVHEHGASVDPQVLLLFERIRKACEALRLAAETN